MVKYSTRSINAESFPTDMKLLLAFLASDSPEDISERHGELLRGADWNQFIELARHHRVFPTINRKLQSMAAPAVPAFLVGLFKRDYYRNTLQMLALSGEIEQLAKQLGDQGIRALFLKGPVIAADLYGDVSLRTSCDLDILIPIEKLEQAEKLLESLGYVKDDYIVSVLNDWRWRHHHTSFLHPKTDVKVELHWRMNPGPGKEPGFDELWERKRKSALINRPIYYLGREDLFLFLTAHGARHGWSRLRWLLDIKQLVRQPIDWPALTALMKKYHYSHLAGQALLLANAFLSEPLRDEMRAMTGSRKAQALASETLFYLERSVNLHSPPLPKEVERYHKRHLFRQQSLPHKLLFMASLLHPYPEDTLTLPLPKSLHLLYFPLRPFLWGWRKLQKTASRNG